MAFLKIGHKNVPQNVPLLGHKKAYSIAFYCGGIDPDAPQRATAELQRDALSKPWYIRWAYRDPDTGKLAKQPHIKAGVNRLKTVSERLSFMRTYRRAMIEAFDQGYNPFAPQGPGTPHDAPRRAPTAQEAIDTALAIKAREMKTESFYRFKSDINRFARHLTGAGLAGRPVSAIGKQHINDYLNGSLSTVKARTRNNYRTSIGTLWQCMEDNGLVERNFVRTIKMIKTVPTGNRPFTKAEFERVYDHLRANDPRSFLVFLLVTYTLLRPKEVCRLKVSDFEPQGKRFAVATKDGRLSTRIVPDIMAAHLPDLSTAPPGAHIIGRDKILERWDARPESKRGKVTGDFRKAKKILGLDTSYGLYSGRHYAITTIYRNLVKDRSQFEAKSILMGITGHASMKSLEFYLRNIGAELPDDYSDLLK